MESNTMPNKNWFKPKIPQIWTKDSTIYAYGIPCIDRYGRHLYYEEMFKFCRQLAKEGFEIYVDELFYDKEICIVKCKSDCHWHFRETIAIIANEVFTIGQAEIDGCIYGDNGTDNKN